MIRLPVVVLTVCVGLFLFSCHSGSPASRLAESEETLPVPAAWSESKGAKAGVDQDWVKRFRDPQLSKLIAEALEQNRDLQAAAARLEQAQQQARITRAAGLPIVDLSTTGSRQQQNFIGLPIGGPDGQPADGPPSARFNQFQLGLNVNWELDIWGRIRAGTAAARSEAEASAGDFQAARASLVAQVVKIWLNLAEARQQLELAGEAEGIFLKTAEAVRERFELGQQEDGGAAAQVRLAETDAANARANRLERQQLLDASTRQLETLLGRYPSGHLVTRASLPAVPSAPPVGLPSELLQRRPDVLAAERRFAASGKRLSEARRALFPRLALTGGGGTTTGDLGDLLNSDFGVWNLAGNIAQPILSGGQLRAEARARFSREREALATLQQTILTAFSEVETALSAEQLLKGRARAVQEAVELARQADAAAREDYARGLGDLLTTLSTQERLVRLRTQLLTLQRLILENRVNLHLALGGDFSPASVL